MIKSVYIHIPFCNKICSYCDFAKIYYNKKYILKYLKALEEEIKSIYNNEILDTIYIGGGTPSALNYNELEELFKIIKVFKLSNNCEFTFECNIDSIDTEKLKLLKVNGVNRLSIGVQTFNNNNLKYLNRNNTKEEAISKINECKKYFENINIDLIYGLKGQSLDDLKDDIKTFLKMNINHISTYSLIIEPHTKLYIDKERNIDEDLEYKMYNMICDTLNNYGYNHYEVSNFSKDGYESKHNLTYWNNLEYYGFGLGAGGFINNKRYTNTRNIDEYIDGNYKKEEEIISKRINMENEMILGLRKIKGVSVTDFKNKYKEDIDKVFNIKKLLDEGKLIKANDYIYINSKYIYLSNDILINFIGE